MVSLIAFVFIPNIQNDAKHKELVKTGVHTEATIVDYEYTQTVMNKEYYTLYYTFTDENSISHGGKTSPAYTFEEAVDLTNSGNKIEIVYNPTTFDSIQATYGNTTDFALWIIPIVASVFILAFSFPFIIEFRKYKRLKRQTNESFTDEMDDYSNDVVNTSDTASDNGSIFTDDTIFCLSKEDFKESYTSMEQVMELAKHFLEEERKSGITDEEYKKTELAVEKEIQKAETLLFNEKYKFNVNETKSNDNDIFKYENPFN